MRRFQDDRYYTTDAPELSLIATRSTLAMWRHQGKGPPYTRSGRRILYLGEDVNQWLDDNRVDPS